MHRVLYQRKPLFRSLLTAASATVVLLTIPGCSLLLGEAVEVQHDDSSLNAAFQPVRDQRTTTQLGTIIADAKLPFDSWDRMYSVYATDSDSINSWLDTDLRWSDLPGDSDSAIQVFFDKGEVVYAVVDEAPRYSVGRYRYATPESTVTTVEKQRTGMNGEPETFHHLEIEEFG